MRTLLLCLFLMLGAVPAAGQTFRLVNEQLQLQAPPLTAGLLVVARPPFATSSFQGVELHFGLPDILVLLPFTTSASGRWSLPCPNWVKLHLVVQCLWLEQGRLEGSQALLLRQNLYQNWANGPGHGSTTWPIGVWLQASSRAGQYRAIGINTYVGLWKGPTATQLGDLAAHQMPVLCAQNQVGLASPHRRWIKEWTHQDEPDNAQWNPVTRKYDPPITPAVIRQRYDDMRKKDPTRPVYLNFGVGVAYEKWIGRGTRTGHLEDYPRYIEGADHVSFDIYPIASPPKPEVKGRLEYVSIGVKRLVGWAREKPVWNWIEAAGISSGVRPTPAQIRSEVWMSIIAGASGTMYFVHEFKPKFIEHTLLVDPVLKAGVQAINSRLQGLASVLHSPAIRGAVSAAPAAVDILVKEHGGSLHLFAVNLTGSPVKGTFTAPTLPAGKVTVLDEQRTLQLAAGCFADSFTAYEVHLYRLP